MPEPTLRQTLQAEHDELAAVADPSPAQAVRRLVLIVGLELHIPEIIVALHWLARKVFRDD